MQLLASTNLQDGAQDMARRVLVHGERIRDVAKLHQVTPQRVSLAIGALRTVYANSSGVRGWALAEIELPGDLIERLQEFAVALRAAEPATTSAALTEVLGSIVQAQRSLELARAEAKGAGAPPASGAR